MLKLVNVNSSSVVKSEEDNEYPALLTLDDLPILKTPHVRIKNPTVVIDKINKIICGGAKKLRIVSDYDSTLTKQHENGKMVNSSFGVFFRGSTQLPEAYKLRDKALVLKYGKIENDATVPIEMKLRAMKEWDTLKVQSVKGIPFDSKEMDDLANQNTVPLREGTKQLFERLEELGVPVLVLSAGLGDMVKALMRSQKILLGNVRVVSNFFKYKGKTLNGFKNNNLINSYNKNENAIGKEFQHWISQPNVISMGDNLGDAFMTDCSATAQNVLKIGFFYNEEQNLLPLYEEAFDIVVIDDQTMEIATNIVNLLR